MARPSSGVWVYIRAESVYAIQPEFKQFVARVGIHGKKERGSIQVEVWLDKLRVHRSPILCGGQGPGTSRDDLSPAPPVHCGSSCSTAAMGEQTILRISATRALSRGQCSPQDQPNHFHVSEECHAAVFAPKEASWAAIGAERPQLPCDRRGRSRPERGLLFLGSAVEKLVRILCTGEHNTRLPHSAFQGQTPDEMYFQNGEHIPQQLEAARQQARQARAEANRKRDCEACELLAASRN